MKKALLIGLMILISYSPGFAVNSTVMKDGAGTLGTAGGVSYYVTRSGITVWAPASGGGVSLYAETLDFGTATGVTDNVDESAASGYIAVYNSKIQVYGVPTISGTSINSPILTGVSSIGSTITGDMYMIDLHKSETISGNSLFGAYLHNYTAASEVTATLPSAKQGMTLVVDLTKDITSGSTIWVVLNSADQIINYPNFKCGAAVSGNSYYYLSGTTGESVTLISFRDGFWRVWENGSPTQGSWE